MLYVGFLMGFQMPRILNPIITKKWLFHHYIELNWTRKMCAAKRKVHKDYIGDLILDYGIQKWKYTKCKVWNIPKQTEQTKIKKRLSQPAIKPIVLFHVGDDNPLMVYASMSLAANKLHLHRENIKKVLQGKRKSTGGFCFKFLDDFKAEGNPKTIAGIKENFKKSTLYEKLERRMKVK